MLYTDAYAKNDKEKGLPPGLQKKAAKGKPLPPGWQKKLSVGQTIDRTIYEHRRVVVPVDKHGIVTVNIDGELIRLVEATREIVEILK